MCGIAASVDLRSRGRARTWALNLMRHRGPDGEGVARDPSGNVALEHCRLAIIDPDNPAADQPFTDPTGRWTIVYNGEVFNFRELRAALERRGVAFRTESDTEVVLLGFIEEGERILDRLRGMFAFVVWDRETGEVFAARDQIGVKPLYYLVAGGVFVACSEVRPLLAYPGFEPELDPSGVVDFLAFGHNLDDRTVVNGMRKLPPGHWLRIRQGRVTVEEWWDAVAPEEATPNVDASPAELLDLLDEAVAAALVSDVPLGLMLSGGIDSSAIAALAVRHVRGSELTAYSVAFGRPDDEAAAAARLARDLGIEHRTVLISEEEIRAGFDDWLANLDYPSADPTWIASSYIARAAHEDGIKVLLTGDGGDELFGGYNRWMKYLRFHDAVWRRAPRPALRLAGRAARPWARGLAGDIARRAATDGELFVPSRPWHDDLLARCLGPVGRAAFEAAPPARIPRLVRQRFDERLPDADYLSWMGYVTLRTHLVEDYLHRLDKMGMRESVEGRVPLLDPKIARWALRVPQRLMVPGHRQKALLRAAVTPVLPDYVLGRPKQGFCPPTAAWTEQLLFERGLLDGGPLLESGLLAPGASAVLRARAKGSRAAFALWTAASLSDWSMRNLAGSGAAVGERAAAVAS